MCHEDSPHFSELDEMLKRQGRMLIRLRPKGMNLHL
jgi:hypothetical protein